ncbi:MAG: AAA family ATPase [Faecalicoccus sp.]|uniref:ATP-binding protein n=2 Tax=Faecalicoccus pleomorphus TaxID=1323 RepID=A0A7X9NIY7_9FIRM|nr:MULTISPECIES: AAA family ATPase [Faecalicoccus]MDY4277895.1 AAA family ATPase [Faecalicoccus sp.]NME43924.1 ATP-binding protein [Faecalicoccus pleomorphus]
MKNTLILLAGYPGTGKTFLANRLLDRFPCFQMLSPDKIKEEFWDEYGFENCAEKEILIAKSWDKFYRTLKAKLENEENVICDYPFSDKQYDTLKQITSQCKTKVITIVMVADIDILFKRQKERDLDEQRHLGHILKKYHKGIKLENRLQADNLLSFEEFYNRCKNRGYDLFSLGETFRIDVSVLYPNMYDCIIRDIEKIICS